MRMFLFSIFTLTLFFVSCLPEYGETKKILLRFDGRAKEFNRTHGLRKEITDPTSYTNLIKSINNSKKSIFFCPPHAGSDWTIKIYKVDEKNNSRLLYHLICTAEDEIGLWDGA